MTPQERIELEKMTLAHWMVGYANGMELQSERDRHAPLIKKLRRAAALLYDGPMYLEPINKTHDTQADQQP